MRVLFLNGYNDFAVFCDDFVLDFIKKTVVELNPDVNSDALLFPTSGVLKTHHEQCLIACGQRALFFFGDGLLAVDTI